MVTAVGSPDGSSPRLLVFLVVLSVQIVVASHGQPLLHRAEGVYVVPDIVLSQYLSGLPGDAGFPQTLCTVAADAYLPASPGPHPAVLLIHPEYGKVISLGDKGDVGGIAVQFAQQGIATLCPNYRTSYPAMLDDCLRAVRWVSVHSAGLRVDPSRVGLAGIGLGGTLALLMGLREMEHTARCVAAIASLTEFGTDDWPERRKSDPRYTRLGWIFPTTAKNEPLPYAEASPISYVSAGDPPLLLICGSDEPLAPRSQSVALQGRLRQVGTPAEIITVSGRALGDFGTDPATYPPATAATLPRVAEFLATRLAAGDATSGTQIKGAAADAIYVVQDIGFWTWFDRRMLPLSGLAIPGGRGRGASTMDMPTSPVPGSAISGTTRTLDVYLPSSRGPHPAVVLIPAGGGLALRPGNKRDVAWTAAQLARAGFVTVCPNYGASYPAAVDQCLAAVKWTRTHATGLHVDPDRVGVMGLSFGGTIGLLLALARPEANLQCVVSVAAPTDLRPDAWPGRPPWGPDAMFLSPGPWARLPLTPPLAEASPITHVSAGAPPVLLVHGVDDPLVPPDQARAMQERLQEVAVPATLISVPGSCWREYGAPPFEHPADAPATLPQVIEFLSAHLRRGGQ